MQNGCALPSGTGKYEAEEQAARHVKSLYLLYLLYETGRCRIEMDILKTRNTSLELPLAPIWRYLVGIERGPSPDHHEVVTVEVRPWPVPWRTLCTKPWKVY